MDPSTLATLIQGLTGSLVSGAALEDGRMALGTWQGVYLCEHRDVGGFGAGPASLIIFQLASLSY